MAKFKKGDKVREINNPSNTDVVKSAPGECGYDTAGFGYSDQGFLLEKMSWEYQKDWESVKQTYTKLTPKVGDKFRVIKKLGGYVTYTSCWPIGHTLIVVRLDTDDSEKPVQALDIDGSLGWIKEGCLTTEYLEPVDEHITIQGVDFAIKPASSGLTSPCESGSWHTNNTYEPIKETKLTTMQKLTSALKRVLSADKQTLYKAGVIGQDLTLTSPGRNGYIDALFDNEGDHKKAVAQMVEDAQAYIDEEKN